MNKLAPALMLSMLVSFAGGAARAADPKPAKAEAAKADAKPAGKEVTLKGTFGCAKCSFKQADHCQNVIKVKDGGKEVTYEVAKNAVSDDNHETVCHSPGKQATVTGTVSKADGKNVVTASKIKFD